MPTLFVRKMEPPSKGPPSKPPPPDLSAVDTLLQQRNQAAATVLRLERIPGHTRELAAMDMSDGSRLWVRFPSPSSSRMLRQEDVTLCNDIDVIHLLAHTQPSLVTKLVKEDLLGTCFGKPCLVTSDLPGVPLSAIAGSVSAAERGRINFAIGSWLSNVAPLTMPSFGIAQQVRARHGQVSWRRVFGQLVQGALMDAEDALLNVPYNQIMQLIYEKGSVFDEIGSANLVLFDAGDKRKTLVDPDTKELTGVLGLSNAAWGDPLAARCFIWPNNSDALAGFGIPTVSEKLQTRLLLYTVYHCVMAIVRDTIRPLEEMRMPDARRRLLLALQELKKP